MATDDQQDAPFDPKRRLCPDGSCIGVIGPYGRCEVCGCKDDVALDANATAPRPSDAVAPDDELALEDADALGDADTGGFDPNRRLCSDGSCVGVIGADDRCRVCGKPA